MSSSSRKVIYAALIANVAIAIGKFTTAAITGSSSMLAEGFHSSVDIGNSLLLLYGLRRSTRPPSQLHPFGHGKELYFWAFVVSVSIFSVGGVLSVWEGAHHLHQPSLGGNLAWNYAVLAFAAVMDGYSFLVSWREINRARGSLNLWQFIRASKDPTVYTVLMEDSSDLLGIAIAFLAIFLGDRLHLAWLDGLGSILIGLLLIAIAFVLGRESKNLLIGESASGLHIQRINEVVTGDPDIEAVGPVLTMQLGPESVLVNLEVRFKPQGSLQALEGAIRRIEDRIRAVDPSIQHIFLEASSLQTGQPPLSS